MAIDQDKMTEFLHKFVGDLGATMAAGNVLVGDRLGFYRALAGHPMLPYELAEHTGTATRYVDEWLRGQAAGGYVEYDPKTGSYSLTPEQAFALTDPGGQAQRGRRGRRHRVRPRRVDDADGTRVRQVAVHRLGLPRGVDHPGA